MKSNSKYLCLPRTATATRLFAVVKILLIIIFTSYLLFLTFWTWFSMTQFQIRIDNIEDDRLIAINKTHKHFFLFTGLYTLAAISIGLWGILKEYTSVILGFTVMNGLGFAFEAVGAFKSKDDDVKILKACSAFPELFLILIAIIFCLFIWHTEKQLANLPIYRQTIVESRRSSIDEHDMNKNGKGHDNMTLNLDDENNQLDAKNNNNKLPMPEYQGQTFLTLPSMHGNGKK